MSFYSFPVFDSVLLGSAPTVPDEPTAPSQPILRQNVRRVLADIRAKALRRGQSVVFAAHDIVMDPAPPVNSGSRCQATLLTAREQMP